MPVDAAVPLDLLDRLLASIAAVVHDRPVQDLVAGKLLVETGRATGDGALLDRGLVAVGRAGDRARDVMWALQPVRLRPDHVARDLAELSARIGAPEVAVQAGAVDDAALAVVGAAVHALAVDVWLGGGRAHRIAVGGDAAGLHATVVADHGTAERTRPWLELAALRVEGAGGRTGATQRGTTTVTDLAVPAGGQPPAG